MSKYYFNNSFRFSMIDTSKNVEFAQETASSDSFDNRQYVIVDWYLQQHGSFSSGGRSRDISLTQFSFI